MKATTYIVGYKDSEDAKVRYFGAFVSESVADFFIAALPEPLEGGFARVVPLQPFTAQEGFTVSRMILAERRSAQPPPKVERARARH